MHHTSFRPSPEIPCSPTIPSTPQSLSRALSRSLSRSLSQSLSRSLSESLSRPLPESLSQFLSRSLSQFLSESLPFSCVVVFSFRVSCLWLILVDAESVRAVRTQNGRKRSTHANAVRTQNGRKRCTDANAEFRKRLNACFGCTSARTSAPFHV